jgi:hypothetical protein
VIADHLAEGRVALGGHASGGRAGGEPARLENDDLTGAGKASVEQGRRDACGLAGAGRSAENCRGVLSQRGN